MNNAFFKSFYQEGLFSIPEKKQNLGLLSATGQVAVDGVEVNEEKSTGEDMIIEAGIPSIGENNKKIVILVEDPDAEFINERDKDFLSKVLGAVKLTFNDIALINTFKNPQLSLEKISNNFDIRTMIVFGKGTSDLIKPTLHKYKIGTLNNFDILHADLLSEIQEDKTKKIKLWEELKKLFTQV